MREPGILLSAEEQALFAEIRFDWQNHEELLGSLAPMEQLASSILRRNVVHESATCVLIQARVQPDRSRKFAPGYL